ncbi:hypothetical protein M0R45_010882 [Rubus argutus]|uniref:Uncharacterized protein n=1 Tax=Rubus argutus TaxID=59490 RepID=A0AAW1YC51_RUBAR
MEALEPNSTRPKKDNKLNDHSPKQAKTREPLNPEKPAGKQGKPTAGSARAAGTRIHQLNANTQSRATWPQTLNFAKTSKIWSTKQKLHRNIPPQSSPSLSLPYF